MTDEPAPRTPGPRGLLERARRPIRRWPLRSTAVVAVVLAAVAAAATATGPSNEIADLKDERASLTDQLAQATADAAATADELGTVEDRLDAAADKLAQIGDLQRRKRSLSRQIADLSAEVDREQAKLITVTSAVAKSSIEDGTWKSGADYIPGTYQAPGGDTCYWAKLSSPSGDGIDGIIENGGFNRHQIVSVDSPYFETRDCGTWRRTG
jgi:hypothetical protein